MTARQMPAIRVDDEVIFPNGMARKLRKAEMAKLDRGEELRLPIPEWRSWHVEGSPSQAAYWKGYWRHRR